MTTPESIKTLQEMLDRVRSVLIILFSSTEFETRWTTASNRFKKWWHGLPAPVSQLTERLYLMQVLCEYFDPAIVKSDQNLIRIALEGSLEVNGQVEFGGNRYEVVRREIGNNFGAAYTLKNKKGEITCHEFFD